MPGTQPTRNIVRWEAPDTIFIALVGRIDGDGMRAVNEAIMACGTGKPFVFALFDLSRTESMTAEARSLAPQPGKALPTRGVAFFGASYRIRVISGLISRVVRLMGKHIDHPTRFFATEAEARAWLAETRTTRPPATTEAPIQGR